MTFTGLCYGVSAYSGNDKADVNINGGNVNINTSKNCIRGNLKVSGSPTVTLTGTPGSGDGSVVSGINDSFALTEGGRVTITGKNQDMLLGGNVTLGTDTAVTKGRYDATNNKYIGESTTDGKYQMVIAYNPVPAVWR